MSENTCYMCKLPFRYGEMPEKDDRGLRHWREALCVARLRDRCRELETDLLAIKHKEWEREERRFGY
jgi:hypothetical protein